jgi:hypothetical protein
VGLWEPQQYTTGFSIYPNPCDGILWIRCRIPDAGYQIPDAGCQILKIYNIQGQELKQFNLESDVVDVSYFQQGIYFIQLQIGDRWGTQKLIVK